MSASMIKYLICATSLATMTAAVISGCSSSSTGSGSASQGNFQLRLTDAPNDQLSSVIVNVNRAEMRVAKGGQEAWIVLAQGLGPVDLLTLQNGVTLGLASLKLPAGAEVTQIRLVLEGDGNYILRGDGSRCDLKTPSGQQSGIKFLISDPVVVDSGYNYAMVADFDAMSSIVLTGNGGCLLKPVLRLKSVDREVDPEATPAPSPSPAPVANSTPAPSPTPSSSSGSTQVSDGSGWDTTTTTTSQPPSISPNQVGAFFQ